MLINQKEVNMLYDEYVKPGTYLIHYGVRGMKWRQERRRRTDDEYESESSYNSRSNNIPQVIRPTNYQVPRFSTYDEYIEYRNRTRHPVTRKKPDSVIQEHISRSINRVTPSPTPRKKVKDTSYEVTYRPQKKPEQAPSENPQKPWYTNTKRPAVIQKGPVTSQNTDTKQEKSDTKKDRSNVKKKR